MSTFYSIRHQKQPMSSTFEPVVQNPNPIHSAAWEQSEKQSSALSVMHSFTQLALHASDALPPSCLPLQQKSIQAETTPSTSLSHKANTTGLPNQLKVGVESLSGFSLDDVQVHYNSSQPEQVGALAYTQGTEIHVGPGQERHLPHEAWHVVQQKQGRVKPTLQMKSFVINDDQELEREADMMGNRSGTAQVEERPLNRSAQPSSAMQMKPVIQRAVGYEFETGWFVEKEEKIPDAANNQQNASEVKRHALKKKDPIGSATYPNFKLEADEAGSQSEIEFIIHPPIPESQEGLTLLLGTMNQMLTLGRKFLEHKQAPFQLNEVTGVPSDIDYLITPDKELRAGPQVTLGLDLAAIPAYLKAQGDKDKTLDPGNAPIDQYPKLKGLLVIMKQYLQRGLKDSKKDTGPALSYPKIIAEPLLARTNFVGLFNLIEDDKKKLYQKDARKWVEDVMNFAGLDPSRAKEDMLSKGVVEGDDEMMEHASLRAELGEVEARLEAVNASISKASSPAAEEKKHLDELKELHTNQTKLYAQIKGMETHAGITVLDWLLGIVSGSDKLREIKTPDSLGEFGTKTEKVGPGGKTDAGIFEYRGAQTNKINLEEWPTFAVNQFMLILRIHGHKLS